MTNEMTDAARDEAFARAQQATFDRIFGHHETKDEPEVETCAIDFKFGHGTNWMDNTRMTPNNSMVGIGEYNNMVRECNGYIMK